MGEYEQIRRDASTCCCKDHPYSVVPQHKMSLTGFLTMGLLLEDRQ